MSNYDEAWFVDQDKKVKGFQKLLQPETRQAIMLIRAPKDMGKTWLLYKMQQVCQQETKGYPVIVLDFRNPREIHRIQDSLGLIRLLRDKLNQPAYFNTLNTTINAFTGSALNEIGLADLRRKIEDAFNLDELKDIAFELKINPENIPGDTLRARSRELINYCQRSGMIAKLVAVCLEFRPNINWSEGLDALLKPTAVATDPNTLVTDNNAPIAVDTDSERQRAEQQINEAFFENLATLLADKSQIVLLFDSYEEANVEAERWIRDQLLVRLRDGQLQELTVIVTGRKTPDLSDLNIKPLLVETQLDPFTEEHVREYLEVRRKITGLDLRTVTLTSGGVPGELALMADRALAKLQADDDFFKDL